MTISAAHLTRAAGLFAVVSGVLYIIIQFVHPAENVATVTGNAWAIVGYMTIAMAVLGLIGVTGIYLRQVTESGLLGLIGLVLFGLFFLLVTAFTFAETLIMPPLAAESPRFVDSFLGIFSGAGAQVDLGLLPALNPVAGVLYVLGGALFGFATFRARVLDRWAALLLALGALLTPVVSLLPHAIGRFAAIPVGLAMIWLGYSLWATERRTVAAQRSSDPRLDLSTAT
ncbi:hypothetical protein H7X46_24240 [Pseudonocardia sp. C8]|uniref:hypothetical protein n=1 Tax=Pseudonocardia sp. C8 TaxID=2762759 RepID=UPI001642F8CC|nr:hypothetical protein [Pseudonocardia sp. C8]